MNAKEAAEKWNTKPRQVNEWYKKEYIEGAVVDKVINELIIPDNSLCPYVERNFPRMKTYRIILYALGKNKTVNASRLGFSKSDLSDAFNDLFANNLIRKKSKPPMNTDDLFALYIISLKGEEYLEDGEKAEKNFDISFEFPLLNVKLI